MLHTLSDYRLPKDLEGTILADIMQAKIHELIGARNKWPAVAIKNALEHASDVRSLKKALLRRTPAVIAEIKRASPSAGLLRRDFDPLGIAREYEEAGAAAISVVTEASYFRGSLEILAGIRWNSGIPLLRKDFIIDPYQILEARHANADAVLLITALLEPAVLQNLRAETEAYGMEALVEVHSERELETALAAGATLIGVNNRNLRSFEVSLEVSMRIAPLLPKEVVAVAESGIHTADDIHRLADAGYRGFLVGEQLMRAKSTAEALKALLFHERPRRAS
ncbi:MAG TPA: indole-3-glycerol phosphate synthase TrpC [Acidobacteriota bacterium]|nr:indole-3-glycerol phosphate synthase TrpC [Acidobacteriota bacterium]